MALDLSDDHFALFGFERSFDVDIPALKARYRELQQVLHPDRFAQASVAERRWSVQASSRINDAYTVLGAPLPRAVYLLSLAGVDIDEETDTAMDPMFLMEQMELREGLEEAGSAADPHAALGKIRRQLGDMAKEAAARFSAALEREDTAAARTEARQWQFLDKLRLEANRVEARLDD